MPTERLSTVRSRFCEAPRVETLTDARLRSICLTGYTEERDSIYEMIWAAGGRHTGRLTKAASHLVRPTRRDGEVGKSRTSGMHWRG